MIPESIKLTKYIRKFFIDNEDLQKLVPPTSIFPIVANTNSKFPYIVMQRTGVRPSYSKGGIIEDSVTMEVIAVSNDYSNSIDIAQEIRKTLDGKRYRGDDILIDDIEIDGITEEFIDNAYLQRISFAMQVRAVQ